MARARAEPARRRIDDPARPLTDEEKRQIVRLLSEPMEFPTEYRSWVKNFVETVGIQLPYSSIVGLKGASSSAAHAVFEQRLPAGSVFLFAGEEPPPGTERYGTGARAAEPELAAPPGLIYVIVTGERPGAVPES